MNGTSMLNNAVEQLDLLWPNETIAQRLEWTGAEPGFGLQQIVNTSWDLAAYPALRSRARPHSKPDPVGR